MLKYSLLYLFLLSSLLLEGQQAGNTVIGIERDSLEKLEKTQADKLLMIYLKEVGRRDELINGRDFFPYYYRSKLKPLLFPDKNRSASLVLKGRTYDDIILHYDTYTDEVILADTSLVFNSRLYEVSLNSDNIDMFILKFDNDTLTFRFFRQEPANGFNLQNGFYEVVSEGSIKYLVRHRSVVHERNGIDEYFYSPVGYVSTGKEFRKSEIVSPVL